MLNGRAASAPSRASAGNNTGADGQVPAFCQPGGNQVWYTAADSQGGAVTANVENSIDCPAVGGMDDELSVAVMTGNAVRPGELWRLAHASPITVDRRYHFRT